MIIQVIFIRQVLASRPGLKFITFRHLSPPTKPWLFIQRRLAPLAPFPLHSYHPLPCNIPLDGHRSNPKFRIARKQWWAGWSPPRGAWCRTMALFFQPAFGDRCPESHSLQLKGTVRLGVFLESNPTLKCLCTYFHAPLSVPRDGKHEGCNFQVLSLKDLLPCSHRGGTKRRQEGG